MTAERSDLRYDVLRRFVNRRLALLGERRKRRNAAPIASPPPPSARELSFAVLARAEKRTASQHQEMTRLREVAPVAEAIDLMEAFAAVVRKQADGGLKSWQQKVRDSGCAEMQRFAEGLSRDQAAVEAALVETWSSGPMHMDFVLADVRRWSRFWRSNWTTGSTRAITPASGTSSRTRHSGQLGCLSCA